MNSSAVFRGPWTHVFTKYSLVFVFVKKIFYGPRTHVFVTIFRGPRAMLRLRRAAYK